MLSPLVGLPLSQALQEMEKQGRQAQVVYTSAPVRPGAPQAQPSQGEGTWRILREKGDELTVGAFHDGWPELV